MSSRDLRQVDVFTAEPLLDNPVAVVHDAGDLTDEEMQRIARWTNLSETTFLVPTTDRRADYRLRIFTPAHELPFAGHPTLGTAHAWLEAGGVPAGERIVQECAVGLVELRREADRLAFAAPPLAESRPASEEQVATIVRALRIDPSEVVEARWLVNGPQFVGVRLRDAAAVLALRPDWSAFEGLEVGVVGLHPAGAEVALEVRLFGPDLGFNEDPVTGSFNAVVAQWLTGDGTLAPSYVAAQGTVIGRRGRVHVDTDTDGTIWVGGDTRTTIHGTITL